MEINPISVYNSKTYYDLQNYHAGRYSYLLMKLGELKTKIEAEPTNTQIEYEYNITKNEVDEEEAEQKIYMWA